MAPFTILYCNDHEADERLDDDHLLAQIQFRGSVVAKTDPRRCVIPLPELGGTTSAEVWISRTPVQVGRVSGVSYASNGDALFLQVHSDEYAPDALQPLTAIAYRRLFAVASAQGYPHFLRIWNYLPDINQECGGLERYRAFCAGRSQVLDATLAGVETRLPAASALGFPASGLRAGDCSAEGGLRLYALAGREAGEQIENPRQISAFHYPPEYGPRSPSFSRAVLKHWGGGYYHLYISGTASVVGHASRHSELMTQLDETLINLEALLAEASQRAARPLQPALLRVYVRPDCASTPLREHIAQAVGSAVPMVFLQADICRQELLIEIEGLAVSAAS